MNIERRMSKVEVRLPRPIRGPRCIFSVFPIEQIENAELRRDSRIAERGPARQALVCPIRLFLIKSLQSYFAAHILHLKNVPIGAESRNMQWITSTQALNDLKTSNNQEAWNKFCNHFQPVVANFARHLGLAETDAEDAAQETMLEFLKAFRNEKYDREQGRLCNWLLGVAKRVILNLRGNRPLERLIADKTTGTSFWDMIKDDHGIKHTWDTEWRRMVLTRCLEQARREIDARVFEAFELCALSEMPVDEVAQRLGMSRNAVYIAKSRVLSRLRQLEGQFE